MDPSMVGLLAALDLATLMWLIPVVLKVAVGLGAVVFVHELGHFLVAKACGVKIEKFMIGFDIGGYKISRRWGETIYGIGILPLGGYVKMLGQDDDPAHIAEQMQKSQVNAASPDAVPIKGPNGETYYIDRRSYLAKSVPQRMAIISAGVVMNIIFAFIFAVVAYGMGVPYMPSIVSQTVPGSPAWQAGIAPGDEIVQLGSRENPTFMQLIGGVTLGNLEEGIHLLVKRAADGEVVPITLKPTQSAGKLASIGITSPISLKLREGLPVIEDSAAARARLVEPAAGAVAGEPKLQGGDRITRVDETAVEDYRGLSAALARDPGRPLVVAVDRPRAQRTNEPESGAVVQAEEHQKLRFEVPPQPLKHFGLEMNMGAITAVQGDSPAAKAGLRVGDLVEMIDGRAAQARVDEVEGWTSLTLPDYLRRAAIDQRDVEFTVRRDSQDAAGAEQLTVRISPVVPTGIHSEVPLGAPVAADAVGIAYGIGNRVQGVDPESSAAGSGIAVGDRITQATIEMPADKNGAQPKPVVIELGAGNPNWPALIDAVQFAPAGTTVEFLVERDNRSEGQKVKLEAQPAKGAFIAPRGFIFEPFKRVRVAASFTDQIRLGYDETADSLMLVFRFLQKLGTQVPVTMLGGPGTIAVAAGASASEGLPSLLIFLTLLSANLAVLNFLPIPLLDGGHMVFLLYEGVRGRPAPERFVLALHTAGFVFIIGLMLFVIGLDIQRWLLS
jgi:regulator of sigma E protease